MSVIQLEKLFTCPSLVKYTEWLTKSKEKFNDEALEEKIPKKALESEDQEPLDWLLTVLPLLWLTSN